MAVSLLIEQIDDKVINKEVPVATLNVYQTHWETIATKKKWLILSNGAYGYDYTEEQLPQLIDEVQNFLQHVKSENEGGEFHDYLVRRAENLLEELKPLRGHRVSFSIG